MARRGEKDIPSPPTWRVAAGALLVALIGAGFGLFRLAHEPTTVVRDREALLELEPGTSSYLVGSMEGGETWEQKRTVVVRGDADALDVTPGELNRWSNRYFRAVETEEGTHTVLGVLDFSFANTAAPNFRILDNGQLQVAVPLEFTALAPEEEFHYIVLGRFYRSGETGEVYFGVEESRLNAAPLTFAGPLQQKVFKWVMAPFAKSPEGEDMARAWPNLKAAEISGPEQVVKFLMERAPEEA
ncbi:MAG: hypothetical protein E1N59_2155 [Puniceicoccaceae bacterium 5H]|nr:MAG: hypothetical protein E1N59_2155 [Puniceicoccaceae bacterium 5H]